MTVNLKNITHTLVLTLAASVATATFAQTAPKTPAPTAQAAPASPQETTEQQQISKQAQSIVRDAQEATDQLALYKRIEQDRAQIQQLIQQYQQAAKPAPVGDTNKTTVVPTAK